MNLSLEDQYGGLASKIFHLPKAFHKIYEYVDRSNKLAIEVIK